MDRIIAVSQKSELGLDDDYMLFESGKIHHKYDRSMYTNAQNLNEELSPNNLSMEIKERLLANVSENDIELAKALLKI